jgi:2-polyprenyl-3-methyl-5-hydroxy-6-metoxy-1,4-benzoquinol methylase
MMTADYALLAPVYDTLKLSAFAADITPRLINYAQCGDWLGRRILDLGCGTGAASHWLARHMYTVVGLDASPEMLQRARDGISTQGLGLTWRLGNASALDKTLGMFDMILALGLMNELSSVREFEMVLTNCYDHLDSGKLLIFDLHTVEGLATQALHPAALLHDTDALMIWGQMAFDYERSALTTRLTLLERADDQWQRERLTQTLRAYPLQVLLMLCQRIGYEECTFLTLDLDLLDIGTPHVSQVVCVLKKGATKGKLT